MSAYENSVYEGEITDAQGTAWPLRFDNAAAMEAELCCRERMEREIDYLTIAAGAARRQLYALTAIVWGAARSAARQARERGERVPPPRWEAFGQAFTLRELTAAQAAICEGIAAYLPGAKKKEAAPDGAPAR